MILYTSPEVPKKHYEGISIFLAGSIEMGTAEDWQSEVVNWLVDLDCVFFNPRRKDWDSSWEQTENNKEFSEQVNWELKHLTESDQKFFYFDASTKSPVTLLELGFVLGQYSMGQGEQPIVVCPKDFYRSGNVRIMCGLQGIEVHDDLDSGMQTLRGIVIDSTF